jgi:hypothetical protein
LTLMQKTTSNFKDKKKHGVMDKSSTPVRTLLSPLGRIGKLEPIIFLVLMICLVAGVVGAVFGFIEFSEGDRFAAKFSALVTADANLQTGLANEKTMRIAGDMTIMSEQSALMMAINQEIATRIAEDAQLQALMAAEVAAREAAQAALTAQLTLEITSRLAADDVFFGQVGNITFILQGLVAYNQWAEQQFLAKMDNLTNIQARLDQEIAYRISNDTTIETQLESQNNQTATYIIAFNNEVITRQTQNAALVTQLDNLVGPAIFTINNYSALNHQFTFQTTGLGYTVSVIGPNIIELAFSGLITFGGLTPDPTTRDIQFIAGNNIQITNNAPLHQFTIALVQVPILPNYQTAYGFITPVPALLVPPNSGSYNTAPGSGPYHFDLDWVGQFINAGSPPSSGWLFPVSGGVTYGFWQIRIQMTLTFFFANSLSNFDPSWHIYTLGICQNTRATVRPTQRFYRIQ